MPLEFNAFTAAFQGLTLGQSNLVNLVPVIMCFIIGLAITRNMHKLAILQLVLATGFAQFNMFVGYVPMMIYIPLFIIETFSIQGLGEVITGTIDTAVGAVRTGTIGLTEATRIKFIKEKGRDTKRRARAQTRAQTPTITQRFADEKRNIRQSFNLAKKRQQYSENLTNRIQPLFPNTLEEAPENEQFANYFEQARRRRINKDLQNLQKNLE